MARAHVPAHELNNKQLKKSLSLELTSVSYAGIAVATATGIAVATATGIVGTSFAPSRRPRASSGEALGETEPSALMTNMRALLPFSPPPWLLLCVSPLWRGRYRAKSYTH